MKRTLILLACIGTMVGCKHEPTQEEIYTKDMLIKLNGALTDIMHTTMYHMEEEASNRASIQPYYKVAKLFEKRTDITQSKVWDMDKFIAAYDVAMDSIEDLAKSDEFKFFMVNVEPKTELLPRSNTGNRKNDSLLLAKMQNDVLVNTITVLRFYQYKMSYENIFGADGKHELEIDTTGLAATKTFKLKLEGLRYRDTLAVTRDMITITENGKDITDEVEFEVYDYDPDVVGIVEMKTTDPGDYEFSGTFDIYFQRKEFVLHQPFNFKFTIK